MTKDVLKLAETEVMVLAKRLHNDLDQEILDRKASEKVELVRKVCDLKSLLGRIRQNGSVLEGTLSASVFVKSAKELTNTVCNTYI